MIAFERSRRRRRRRRRRRNIRALTRIVFITMVILHQHDFMCDG
jgi:hypothetical protein